MTESSASLFQRAVRVIPGGVNSPVRAFGSVGGAPVYMERGAGSRLFTADGRELIDFCGSWGPLILGHAHPAVVEAVCEAARNGTSFGANTRREVEFAELLGARIPSLERVRLVNSGTEAVMTALRLARGVTGRAGLLKFDGCYHGHADSMLIAAGSGLLTGGIAACRGIPPAVAADVWVAPYNDLAAVKAIVRERGAGLAAIIVEPVAGNMGLVKPAPGFLEGLRAACDRCGALLILDEVITGFRFGPTTYGELAGIVPDLTCLGKIIGGGMPLGAVGGRRAVMEALAPLGEVYQAGTLSGNPVAVAAGLATLTTVIAENPYPRLAALGRTIADGINRIAQQHGLALHAAQEGSLFTPFFRKERVENLAGAKGCDTRAFAAFFHGMLDRGIYLPPSQFELSFVSSAHLQDDLQRFLEAAEGAIGKSGG
jgi:glutamate-1-semialdehyde 2,1-aminomutase